jgi:hypothetical protein
MGWFKNKVKNWLFDDRDSAVAVKALLVEEGRVHDDPVLNLRIFNAQNGRIIEFRKYDPVKDRTEVKTYIVEPEKDIGEYLGKCVSVELLRG